MVKKSCSQFWFRVTAKILWGVWQVLSWQVGQLEPSPGGLVGKENCVVFYDLELQRKCGKKTVCLALLWHPALFRAHETTIALKWLLCQWIGGKMMVCFCLPAVCWSLNMPMCDPRCLVNSSLNVFVLHNVLTDHFFLYVCLVSVTAVSVLMVCRCKNSLCSTSCNWFLKSCASMYFVKCSATSQLN